MKKLHPRFPVVITALCTLLFCQRTVRAGYIDGKPPVFVHVTSDKPHNVFYSGQTVALRVLDKGASRYEIRNYQGDLVDSGTVTSDTIVPKVSALGWFKLYLFGADAGGIWKDAVGSTTFCIFRRDSRFPDFPTTFKALTRNDAVIDFKWNGTSPAPGLPAHGFRVNWSGEITPLYSENYDIYTSTDYGCRIWLDDKLIVDHSVPNRGLYWAHVDLVKGQKYRIRMEYVENKNVGGEVHLLWHSPSQAWQPLPGPFSADYYDDTHYVSADGAHDDVLHGVIGAGLQRLTAWNADGGESLGDAMTRLAHDIAIAKEFNEPVLIAFSDGTTTKKDGKALSDADRAAQMDKVRAIVTKFKGDVHVWEGRNEPNFGASARDFAVNEAKPFYDLAHSIDPSAKVIGPGTVEINKRDSSAYWIEDFLKNGGGKSIDAFSFHAYNSVNGDANLARRSMAALNVLLAKYDLVNIEKWQTEQGQFAARYGAYTPRHQGAWTMLQRMVYDQDGIPKEHDHLWYDKSHGFWDQPTWLENDDGSLNPAAPLMRVYSEETSGTTFNRVLDFGAAGNNLVLGSVFQSATRNVAALTTTGALNVPVTLQFSNNTPVKVVDAWGASSTQTPVNGRLTITVSELPTYVEAASSQSIDVVPFNWGTNLARAAKFSYTSGSAAAPYDDQNATNDINKLGDGLLESWYLDGKERPWASNQSEISESKPVNIEVQLSGVQTVNHAVVYACVPWSWQGSLLDYELFYDAAGSWKSLGRVTEPEKTLLFADALSRSSLDSFYSERSIFPMSFTSVTTGKLKLAIYKTTKGGAVNAAFETAGGQTTGFEQVTLREIEVYNEPGNGGDIPAVTPSNATLSSVSLPLWAQQLTNEVRTLRQEVQILSARVR